MHEDKLKQILKKVNDPSYQIEVSEHSDSTKASANADVIFKILQILRKKDPNTWKAWHDAVYYINYNFPMKRLSYFGGLIVGFSAQEEHLSLLQVAASSGYTNVMKALIGKGADIVEVIPTSVNCNNRRFTKKERAEERKKPIVNRKDIQGRTLLHLAAESGNIETVQFLLDNGAKIDAKDNDERTPLFLAALNNDRTMVNFLKENGANVYNHNFLHSAVEEDNTNAVEIFLDEGLSPYSSDSKNKTPIDLAKDFNMKCTLKDHIQSKLRCAVLKRNFKAADEILDRLQHTYRADKIFSYTISSSFFEPVGGHFLRDIDSKKIIKAIQLEQAVGFACGGGIAAGIGIPIAIALPLSYAMTPGIITATTIAGGAGFIGLLCLGFAVFHAFKEFPSAQVNEPRSTGAGAEAPIPGQ